MEDHGGKKRLSSCCEPAHVAEGERKDLERGAGGKEINEQKQREERKRREYNGRSGGKLGAL